MKTLTVETGKPYDIIIERGSLQTCGSYISKVSCADKIAVISDTNVFPIYGDTVVKSCESAGFSVCSYIFKAGEQSKNLHTIADMYDFLAQNHITRKDLVVALGGGVTGDMAGFAAATYLRGIDFVQIPTSLLAQVDSSVGGKTGVDIAQGKNLVGAFWQPNLVLIDSNTLDTLPPCYINDGMAEIIKYGCIKDKVLFEKLENEDAMEHIDDVICQCVSIKRDVVSRDEREKGERMLLNFGHTLGHSLEKAHHFKDLSHGQAVAVGMVLITRAAEQAQKTPRGTADRIRALCQKYKLPVSDPTDTDTLVQGASGDKKNSGEFIHLVLLKELGDSYTEKLKLSDLKAFLTQSDT